MTWSQVDNRLSLQVWIKWQPTVTSRHWTKPSFYSDYSYQKHIGEYLNCHCNLLLLGSFQEMARDQLKSKVTHYSNWFSTDCTLIKLKAAIGQSHASAVDFVLHYCQEPQTELPQVCPQHTVLRPVRVAQSQTLQVSSRLMMRFHISGWKLFARRNWNRKACFHHHRKWGRGVQRGYTDGDDDESVMPEAPDMGESLGCY